MSIPRVNLTPDRTITVEQDNTRAFSLSEKLYPHSDGSAASVDSIIKALHVETALRYKRGSAGTFCNIYAHDFSRLMGAYVPRVWWTDGAISAGVFGTPVYGRNVVEMNVNSLYKWFQKYGPQFGWIETDKSSAQKYANSGECVVMLAANKDASRSGHITMVVPETSTHKAVGSGGITVIPLQSQAGAVNKAYFATDWWKSGHQALKVYVYKG